MILGLELLFPNPLQTHVLRFPIRAFPPDQMLTTVAVFMSQNSRLL